MASLLKYLTANGRRGIGYEKEATLGVGVSEHKKGRKKIDLTAEGVLDVGTVLKHISEVKSTEFDGGIDLRVTDSEGTVHEHFGLDQEHVIPRIWEYFPVKPSLTDVVQQERYSDNQTVRHHYHIRRGTLAEQQPEEGGPLFNGDLVAEAYIDFIRKVRSDGTRQIKKP
jgi:hypothetical protein|tara:strand:+ start:777 stop:1283 length:507 start_codon:yes stop_codon:yes gene_type:complete